MCSPDQTHSPCFLRGLSWSRYSDGYYVKWCRSHGLCSPSNRRKRRVPSNIYLSQTLQTITMGSVPRFSGNKQALRLSFEISNSRERWMNVLPLPEPSLSSMDTLHASYIVVFLILTVLEIRLCVGQTTSSCSSALITRLTSSQYTPAWQLKDQWYPVITAGAYTRQRLKATYHEYNIVATCY